MQSHTRKDQLNKPQEKDVPGRKTITRNHSPPKWCTIFSSNRSGNDPHFQKRARCTVQQCSPSLNKTCANNQKNVECMHAPCRSIHPEILNGTIQYERGGQHLKQNSQQEMYEEEVISQKLTTRERTKGNSEKY